jgi:hypothetical protein
MARTGGTRRASDTNASEDERRSLEQNRNDRSKTTQRARWIHGRDDQPAVPARRS